MGRYFWQLPVYLVAAFVRSSAARLLRWSRGAGWSATESAVGTALIGAGLMVLLAWLLMVRAVVGSDRPVSGYEGRSQADVGVQE